MFSGARNAGPFGIVSAASVGAAPEVQASSGSASVGVFSSLNHWSQASQVIDLVPGITLDILFEVTGHANNQCLWGCADSTHGWFLIHGTTNNLVLFFRGAGGGSWTISTNLFLGYHCLALSRITGGSVRCSLDGATDFELVASPTYTANLGTAKQFIGYDTGESNFAAVNSRVLSVAVLNQDSTSAERESFSNAVNNVDRYRLLDSLRTNSSLVSELHFDRDWDGSASTVTAGLGSAPYTLTRVGTGGGKNIIAPELRYLIKQEWVHDNGYWIQLVTGIRRHSQGARTRFTTDATRMIVDCYATNSGFLNQVDVGVKSDGVKQTGNSTGGLDLDTFNKLRALDITLPAGAGKSIEIIDGIQSLNVSTGEVLGIFPQYIRVPATTPITPLIVTPPNRRIIVVSDSRAFQVLDVVTNITSATYQAWTMLAREDIAASIDANWTGCQLSLESYGSNSWAHIFGDSTKRATFVAQIGPMLDGTAGTHANRIVFDLGPNDFVSNTYASLGALESDVGAGLDATHSAYPSAEIFLLKPTAMKNETTNNASGWNLPGLRTSLGNVASTRGWITLIDASSWVSLTNRDSDTAQQLHFEAAGHVEYKGNFKTAMGY
jgi:hypothetical protein